MEDMVIQNFFTVKTILYKQFQKYKTISTEITFEVHYEYIGILPLWLQWLPLGF